MEEIEEIITFDYIREAYIAEKNENKLSNLPKDFFKKADNYFKIKEEILKNSQDEKVRYELKNAKKMVDEIILIRLKKIVEAVFIFLKTGNIPSNMLKAEETFFFEIIELVKSLKKNLFFSGEKNEELENNKKDFFSSSDSSNTNLNLNVDNKQTNIYSENQKNINLVSIKILVDLPKFVGPDGNYYGPFGENEIIELEEEIAKFLVEGGFASFNI